MYEQIPQEIKALPNWICWDAVPDEKRGKIKKVPINALTGGGAMSNNPSTWCDFDTAVRASEKHSGIGFMFGGCPYFGVDIDGKEEELEAYQGERTATSYPNLSPPCKAILRYLNRARAYISYAEERSQSVADAKTQLRCMRTADFSL